MELSTQTSNSSFNDPLVAEQAANMTRAIFERESGTNYDIKGDAGTSSGAGQWQDATWKAEAGDVLGDSNAAMTKENQSVVAQGTIRKWISEGLNAAQIAAKWNSGSSDNWQDKVGTRTINGKSISYNVPQYVKDVTDLYQKYKGQKVFSDTSGAQVSQPFSTPLSNIASGQGAENVQGSIGAAKGLLSTIRSVSGVDTNPVVKAQLANAPAFAADVNAEKGFLTPTNFAQTKGSAESKLGATLLMGSEPAAEGTSGLLGMASSPIAKSLLKFAAKKMVGGALTAAGAGALVKVAEALGIDPLSGISGLLASKE